MKTNILRKELTSLEEVTSLPRARPLGSTHHLRKHMRARPQDNNVEKGDASKTRLLLVGRTPSSKVMFPGLIIWEDAPSPNRARREVTLTISIKSYT